MIARPRPGAARRRESVTPIERAAQGNFLFTQWKLDPLLKACPALPLIFALLHGPRIRWPSK